MAMLISKAFAILLVTVPGLGSPGPVELVTHKPGHVLQDRRDELQGGMRLQLQGVRPRPTVTPRSLVRPASPQLQQRQPALSTPIAPPRSRGLPRVVSKQGLAACRARYQSFDATSGTYRTYSGALRRCPYLP